MREPYFKLLVGRQAVTESVSTILWHRKSPASYVHDSNEIKNEAFQFLPKTEDVQLAALLNKSIKKTVVGIEDDNLWRKRIQPRVK